MAIASYGNAEADIAEIALTFGLSTYDLKRTAKRRAELTYRVVFALTDRRRAMRITRITVSAIVALSMASAAYAQEALKGEVVTVDKASKKIGIKLSGTVGSSDATAPTPFKVQDARVFNVVKPGDKVSFTAERVGGVMTIKELTKE